MTLKREDIDAVETHVRLSIVQLGSILASVIGGTLVVGGLLLSIKIDIAKLDAKTTMSEAEVARVKTEQTKFIESMAVWKGSIEEKNNQQSLDIQALQVEYKNLASNKHNQ